MTALPQGFPEGFINSMRAYLGDETPAFLRALDAPFVRGVRLRPGAPVQVSGGVLAPVPWQENAFYIPVDSQAGAHPLHEAGAYYLQEPSAMTAAAALRPAPGERVLDLCAAPGGKSTQLSAYMSGRGVLVCNEPVQDRARILSRNIERMGVCNAVVTSAYPERLAERWQGFFDAILVDAPCSGEGMFRRHPEARLQWNENSARGCAARQTTILESAARMLRPGGRMLYSTCTFNEIENEGVVRVFLAAHADFSQERIALPGLPSQADGAVRVFPHRAMGEGHFAALLRKAQDDGVSACAPARLPAAANAALAALHSFCEETQTARPASVSMFGDCLVAPPADCPPLDGVRVFRLGLHLGAVRGVIFTPDHALALSGFVGRTLPVDCEAARRFQHGETLPVAENLRGYFVPVLDAFALGFGKASGGVLKNHYPKGLRR